MHFPGCVKPVFPRTSLSFIFLPKNVFPYLLSVEFVLVAVPFVQKELKTRRPSHAPRRPISYSASLTN